MESELREWKSRAFFMSGYTCEDLFDALEDAYGESRSDVRVQHPHANFIAEHSPDGFCRAVLALTEF
jgi:hypothetical protein